MSSIPDTRSQSSSQIGSLLPGQSVMEPEKDTGSLSTGKRKLPNWLVQVRQSQNQEPVSPDGEFLLRNPTSGSVIDQSFKKEFVRPLIKELANEYRAGRLTTNQVMRKLITKGKVKFPQVFKPSVTCDMYQVSFRTYAYRSYQFMCGVMHVEDAGDELIDRTDPDWVKACSNRYKHCNLSKSKDNYQSRAVKKSIKAMSAQQFVNYCEGTFSTSELKILRDKCNKECNQTLWQIYSNQ